MDEQTAHTQRTPWHKVGVGVPAIVGLLIAFGGFQVFGAAAIVGGFVAMVALIVYRIATRA